MELAPMKLLTPYRLGLAVFASFVMTAMLDRSASLGILPPIGVALLAGYLIANGIAEFLFGIASAVVLYFLSFLLILGFSPGSSTVALIILPVVLVAGLVLGALCFCIGRLARLLHVAACQYFSHSE
jgi:hypothetical protein